jgi:hypothetical protein
MFMKPGDSLKGKNRLREISNEFPMILVGGKQEAGESSTLKTG